MTKVDISVVYADSIWIMSYLLKVQDIKTVYAMSVKNVTL